MNTNSSPWAGIGDVLDYDTPPLTPQTRYPTLPSTLPNAEAQKQYDQILRREKAQKGIDTVNDMMDTLLKNQGKQKNTGTKPPPFFPTQAPNNPSGPKKEDTNNIWYLIGGGLLLSYVFLGTKSKKKKKKNKGGAKYD